jgi:hypothetical protein
MTATEKTARKVSVYFRNSDEKNAAVEWANGQGYQSLNAYFLFLWRQDKRNATPVLKPELSAYRAEAHEDLSSE